MHLLFTNSIILVSKLDTLFDTPEFELTYRQSLFSWKWGYSLQGENRHLLLRYGPDWALSTGSFAVTIVWIDEREVTVLDVS
jgi:hypothetical protein